VYNPLLSRPALASPRDDTLGENLQLPVRESL
jgi:hypothetical protein